MTFYTPPSFNFANASEAIQAAEWVERLSAAIPQIVSNGLVVNSYSTLIGRVIEAGFGGDYEAKCLAFVEGAIAAGSPVYAECVHDLHLGSWLSMSREDYRDLISDIFARSKANLEDT